MKEPNLWLKNYDHGNDKNKNLIPFYNIKPVEDLTNLEILIILDLWNIDSWKFMEPSEFKSRFRESEIHFLKDDRGSILCLARISFNFTLKISGTDYYFTEFAGLVSSQKHKGFGLMLIELIIENMKQRDLDSIGFSDKKLRSFYDKSKAGLLMILQVLYFNSPMVNWLNHHLMIS